MAAATRVRPEAAGPPPTQRKNFTSDCQANVRFVWLAPIPDRCARSMLSQCWRDTSNVQPKRSISTFYWCNSGTVPPRSSDLLSGRNSTHQSAVQIKLWRHLTGFRLQAHLAWLEDNSFGRPGAAHPINGSGDTRPSRKLITAGLLGGYCDRTLCATNDRIIGPKWRGGSEVYDEPRIFLCGLPYDRCAGIHTKRAVSFRAG